MNEFKRKAISIISGILTDRQDIELTYWIKTHQRINLNNPITFNDKIQWYKLNYRVPLMTKCADKVLVREYVKECGLEHILTKQYGVYRSPEEIDFNQIPDDCFLKCNHNSAGNFHWKRRENPDIRDIRTKFKKMLKINQFDLSREWAYKNIPPRIICEEYLKVSSPEKFVDYNFFCFNGEPKLIMYNLGLCAENGDHADGKRAVLNTDFNMVDMVTPMQPLTKNEIIKPDNFEEMLEYARILSRPFPHVRVDFFHVDGEIHFGELTFYSGSGFGNFKPDKWQKIMGDWFVLPAVTINE